MKQTETPLFDMLMNWKRMNPLSFHVPGHKNGKVFPNKADDLFASILSIDVTELDGLDDLHEPEGAIKRAQQLTAHLYGCDTSYFLVGGSTAGNLAMIMATCFDGDTVFVQRNSHKSIIHGLEMANAHAVFLTPDVDEQANVPVGLTLETIKEAYEAYPQAKALILTNPNYYGMTIDLEAIIQFAHEKEIAVLVDEAHGAHFGIGEPFPKSALSLGADVVVQSAHKTLPALTMGSYLHVSSRYVHKHRLKTYLTMLQSSSPSYPIMASLDLARYYLAKVKESEKKDLIDFIQAFRSALAQIQSIRVIEPSHNYELDPLKVVIQSTVGLSGFELQALLEEEQIYTELADEKNVLFVMPLSPFFNISKVTSAVSKATQKTIQAAGDRDPQVELKHVAPYSSLAFSYKKMARSSTRYIHMEQAVGRIAAESITPYPPGIPAVMKGEKITTLHMAEIMRLLDAGARFHGGNRLEYRQVLVFKNRE